MAYGRPLYIRKQNKQIQQIIRAKDKYLKYKAKGHKHGAKKWRKIWKILKKQNYK